MRTKLFLLIGGCLLVFAAVIIGVMAGNQPVKVNENGYYVLDDYAFEQGDFYSEESVDRLAAKINTLQATLFSDNKVFVSIIPEKEFYADERAPKKTDYAALVQRLDERLAEAELIRIEDTLSLESYYRTDPHWKQEALFLVAERLGEHMNFSVSPSDFTTESAENMQGTCASYIELGNLSDTLTWLIDPAIEAADVTYYDHPESKTVYNTAHLDENPYDLFLEGATPLLTIDNPLCQSGRTLVIFRDSYGSSLVPLLISQYSRIIMVDLRYMHSALLSEMIDFSNAEGLFLFSTSIANQSLVLR